MMHVTINWQCHHSVARVSLDVWILLRSLHHLRHLHYLLLLLMCNSQSELCRCEVKAWITVVVACCRTSLAIISVWLPSPPASGLPAAAAAVTPGHWRPGGCRSRPTPAAMTNKQLTKFMTDHAVDDEVDSRVDGDKNIARLNQMTSYWF